MSRCKGEGCRIVPNCECSPTATWAASNGLVWQGESTKRYAIRCVAYMAGLTDNKAVLASLESAAQAIPEDTDTPMPVDTDLPDGVADWLASQ